MKLIDANTGLELEKGSKFRNVNGDIEIIDIMPGIFSATAKISRPANRSAQDPDGLMYPESRSRVTVIVPLIVRWSHPSYFGQHVAFFPS